MIIYPVVIDTNRAVADTSGVFWQHDGYYAPFYIGRKKDTISEMPDSLLRFFLDQWEEYAVPGKPNSQILLIRVDTTQFLLKRELAWMPGKVYEQWARRKAYPVFLYNKSSDSLDIGIFKHISLVMEALDRDGKWKPLESHYILACGTGVSNLLLPPGEIAVTGASIYPGNFKTRIRLNCWGILSNEFTGTIDPLQFESAYDKDGQLKSFPKKN